MAKKRVTRKQLLNEPDEFITTTGKLIAWAKENLRSLIIGTGIFFAVIIGLSIYGIVSQQKAETALTLFSQAVKKYETEAENENHTEALEAVRADFDAFLKSHGGQPAGKLGRIFYGHINLAAKAYDQAIALYKEAMDEIGGNSSMTNIILNGLATAYQQKGASDQAIAIYKKIADGPDKLLKDAALFNLGKLYGMTDKPEESKKAYEQLTTDFPDSMFVNMAREKGSG